MCIKNFSFAWNSASIPDGNRCTEKTHLKHKSLQDTMHNATSTTNKATISKGEA